MPGGLGEILVLEAFNAYLWLFYVQLRQNQVELQEVQMSYRHLTARLEELTEETSLHSLTPHQSSLMCEIEQSMEQEEQEQEREQVNPPSDVSHKPRRPSNSSFGSLYLHP